VRPLPLLITLWNCATIAAYSGSHGVPSHRFVSVADGIVLDARAHLEWTSRDHVQPLPWGDADRFCRESSRGGRTGWRLPEHRTTARASGALRARRLRCAAGANV